MFSSKQNDVTDAGDDFSFLPGEVKKNIYDFVIGAAEFTIFNLNESLKQGLYNFKKLMLINKTSHNFIMDHHNFLNELIVAMITQLGIELKKGVLPWKGYQHPLNFLNAIHQLYIIIQRKKPSIEKIEQFCEAIPSENAVLPHLIYLFLRLSSIKIPEGVIIKQLVNAVNGGNISSAFARMNYSACISFNDKSSEAAESIVVEFLKHHNIRFTKKDEQLFYEAFSFHTPKAIKFYQQISNSANYSKLNHNHSVLLNSLILSEEPQQVFDTLINTNSLDKFLGERADLLLIQALSRMVKNYIDNSKFSKKVINFLKKLLSTVPEVKSIVSDKYFVPTRVKNENETLILHLQNIISRADILEKNHHIIDFILQKKQPLLKKYAHIHFLILYPELISAAPLKSKQHKNKKYLSVTNVNKISESKVNFFIDNHAIFKEWKHNDLINFLLAQHSMLLCKAFESAPENFRNIKREEIDFINSLNQWTAIHPYRIDNVFKLMSQFSVKFIEDCYKHNGDQTLFNEVCKQDPSKIVNFIFAHGGIHNPEIFELLEQEFLPLEVVPTQINLQFLTSQELLSSNTFQSETIDPSQSVHNQYSLSSPGKDVSLVRECSLPDQNFQTGNMESSVTQYQLFDINPLASADFFSDYIFELEDEISTAESYLSLFGDSKLEPSCPALEDFSYGDSLEIEDYSSAKNKQPVADIKAEIQEEKSVEDDLTLSQSYSNLTGNPSTLFCNHNKRKHTDDNFASEKKLKL